jgi:dihydrodipicolinate synthase/N-acetylneuraminate lyase
VHANLPEQHTAAATRAHVQAAVDAGIEVIHLYTLEGRHGMRPTESELAAYFDTVLAPVDRPVALAVNTTLGYAPKPSAVAEICRRNQQIVAIRMSNLPDIYMIELQQLIARQMHYFVMLPGSLNALVMGANGVFGVEANILPKTFRRYLDQYEAGDMQGLAGTYADLARFNEYVKKWNPSTPRWLKMSMQSLKLPGGEGGVREPYQMPPADEVQRFTDGLLRLGIPEVDEMARTAGLKVAA